MAIGVGNYGGGYEGEKRSERSVSTSPINIVKTW